jgi:hypothetical protein
MQGSPRVGTSTPKKDLVPRLGIWRGCKQEADDCGMATLCSEKHRGRADGSRQTDCRAAVEEEPAGPSVSDVRSIVKR